MYTNVSMLSTNLEEGKKKNEYSSRGMLKNIIPLLEVKNSLYTSFKKTF